MADKREYIVTVKKGIDWREVHAQLVSDNSENPIENIPNRIIDVIKLRETNIRNTHYDLTDAEAENLRKDDRILGVQLASLLKIKPRAFQDGNFNKEDNDLGEHQNWGLLRHTSITNNFGVNDTDPGGNYNYVLDGTGVDVVIQSTGIQADHPEFQDNEGSSRIDTNFDWFVESGISGTMPTNHYTDINGSGTAVTSIIAGKKFGWAKNSQIYVQTLFLNPSNSLSIDEAFDTLLGWHNTKDNGRPTIVYMPWSNFIVLDTNRVPNVLQTEIGQDLGVVTGATYRGTTYNITERDDARIYGSNGQDLGNGYYEYPYSVPSIDADVETLIDAGIIVIIPAGNSSMKIDSPGGLDYDNSINFTYTAEYGGGNATEYYHRGGSPNIRSNSGLMVGAIGRTDNTLLDKKTDFSNSGPGVNIYAAGDYVITALSNTRNSTFYPSREVYYDNSNYYQTRSGGTSYAGAQIAGMCALLLQAHPEWTPSQVMNWIIQNSQDKIYSTGLDNDYTVTDSLWGGTARVAYFPMSGTQTFTITSS